MDEKKLANIERFEKGVGVEIDTFIDIITNGFYYREGNEIYYERNAIFIGIGYLPQSNSMVRTHFSGIQFTDYGEEKDQHHWDWKNKKDVFNFKDYGKTWALTTEELMEE